MNATDELLAYQARTSASRFFLGIARKAREPKLINLTEPLFGLSLILEAEGLLAKDEAPCA